MMYYLKNQGKGSFISMKNLSFEEVKKEFDKHVKQVESFAPINFEASKASLKRFGEELQTKTPKRLKDDEAKDAEPAKKSGKRREIQLQGKDCIQTLIRVIYRDDLTKLYRIVMNRYGMDGPEDELEKFTMSNQHKNWLVQEQTALGKDFSNPFYG
ncbi:hypothetical protein Tco_1538099 [Tanacetum coccineum]